MAERLGPCLRGRSYQQQIDQWDSGACEGYNIYDINFDCFRASLYLPTTQAMTNPKEINVQIGNDLSGVINFGHIQGDVSAGSTAAKGPAQTYSCQADMHDSLKRKLSAGPWKVFLSHTSELRDYPPDCSYIDKAERAVSAAGHIIQDMIDFPAMDMSPANICIQRVRDCDVYVGIYGMRYGSPVRDLPEVSYTELEFNAATEAGLARLIFLIDPDSAELGLPAKALIDRDYGDRQDIFLKKVMDSDLTVQRFSNPDELKGLIERSLRDLAGASAKSH